MPGGGPLGSWAARLSTQPDEGGATLRDFSSPLFERPQNEHCTRYVASALPIQSCLKEFRIEDAFKGKHDSPTSVSKNAG